MLQKLSLRLIISNIKYDPSLMGAAMLTYSAGLRVREGMEWI